MAGQEHGSVFPKMVHQTWKSKSVPPHQTLRWRTACKELNPQYDFKMFDDDDLMTFTLKYYPKYGTVLQALKGV
jgi:mannosyltransferase OCH1-like enzyme